MPPVRDWVDRGVPVRILTRNARGRWKDTYLRAACLVLWRNDATTRSSIFSCRACICGGLPVARALKKPIVMKVAEAVISVLRSSRIGRVELGWLRGGPRDC